MVNAQCSMVNGQRSWREVHRDFLHMLADGDDDLCEVVRYLGALRHEIASHGGVEWLTVQRASEFLEKSAILRRSIIGPYAPIECVHANHVGMKTVLTGNLASTLLLVGVGIAKRHSVGLAYSPVSPDVGPTGFVGTTAHS